MLQLLAQDPYVVVQGCSVVPYSCVGDSDGELLPPPLLAVVVLKMLTLHIMKGSGYTDGLSKKKCLV